MVCVTTVLAVVAPGLSSWFSFCVAAAEIMAASTAATTVAVATNPQLK